MTTNLWRLLEREVNRKAGRFQRAVIAADMARATGLSPQVISKWKNIPTMPSVEHLATVRDKLGVPWPDLLDAILTDKGYLPEPPSLTQSLKRAKKARASDVEDSTGT